MGCKNNVVCREQCNFAFARSTRLLLRVYGKKMGWAVVDGSRGDGDGGMIGYPGNSGCRSANARHRCKHSTLFISQMQRINERNATYESPFKTSVSRIYSTGTPAMLSNLIPSASTRTSPKSGRTRMRGTLQAVLVLATAPLQGALVANGLRRRETRW